MTNTGTVKSWSDERGFGFIIPKNGGNDVFVHRKAIGMSAALVPYKEVRYEYQIEQGKPKASMVMGDGVKRLNIASGGGGYTGNIGGGGGGASRVGLQVGTVKSWVPEKGFGFIRTANAADGDLFVLSTQTRGNLIPGAKVTFTVGSNPRTHKPWAEGVTMVGDGAANYGSGGAQYGGGAAAFGAYGGGGGGPWGQVGANPSNPYGSLVV